MALSVLRMLLNRAMLNRVSKMSMEEAVHYSAVHDEAVSYRACVMQAGCFSLQMVLSRLE